MPKLIELTGQRFGSLVAIGRGPALRQSKQANWRCRCDCGAETFVRSDDLRSGNTKSCGCMIASKRVRTRYGTRLRKCAKCAQEKDLSEFYFSRKRDNYRTICIACNTAWGKAPKTRAKIKQRNRLIREKAIAAYGGVCRCCGETRSEFLEFDHINGGGNQHRGELIGQGFANVASWLTKNKFPKGFQLLCSNCNRAKAVHSVCPHQVDTVIGLLSMGG